VSNVRAALPLVRFGSPTRQSPADQFISAGDRKELDVLLFWHPHPSPARADARTGALDGVRTPAAAPSRK
jgi:hypothetical protein